MALARSSIACAQRVCRRNGRSSMKTYTVLLAVICAGGCAATNESSPEFLDTYAGDGGSAEMRLDLIRELPPAPESGWLIRTKPDAAGARFRARRRGPTKQIIEPTYVEFQDNRENEQPVGKYFWRDDALNICMLTLTPGVIAGSDKLAFRFEYDTCAVMRKAK
jgi:hypothetical protein